MASAFKDVYSPEFFETLCNSLCCVEPSFDRVSFLESIYTGDWASLELKQRMRHITYVLDGHLNGCYKTKVEILLKLIDDLRLKGVKSQQLAFIFLPDFIEVFGQDQYDVSVDALETITQFITAEFAVRPFIIRYPCMMDRMLQWSHHANEHVRRLASEGCRPRLPWAMALPRFKEDPAPILPILKNLKEDSSEYVRRSVANNLNDIAKDHPQLVIQTAHAWYGQTPNLDRLVKHACRTLLKEGNPRVMNLFGFVNVEEIIKIHHFKIETPKVRVGDDCYFSFELENLSDSDAKIRLEYGIDYQKANGSLSRKVFKISEKFYPAHSNTCISRKQSFKPISTRKYHLGLHRVVLILNGVVLEQADFDLIN